MSQESDQSLVDFSVPTATLTSPPLVQPGATPPSLVLSAVLASGSDVTGVRGQVDSGSAVAEAVGVTAGHVGFSSGKEKASPASRPAHSDPQAPDSESIIVAMERVSVLFDRYTHAGTPSVYIRSVHTFIKTNYTHKAYFIFDLCGFVVSKMCISCHHHTVGALV